MRAKQFFRIFSKFTKPIEVYRLGWMVLAGTSGLYLFLITIRLGLGLNFDAGPPIPAERTALKQKIPHVAATKVADNAHFNQQNNEFRDTAKLKQKAHQKMAMRTREKTRKVSDRSQVSQSFFSAPAQKANLLIIPSEKTKVTPKKKKKRLSKSTRKKDSKRKEVKKKKKSPVVKKKKQSGTHTAYVNTANYVQGFTHDLQIVQGGVPVVTTKAPKKVAKEIYGVGLAKGRSVSDVRKKWAWLSNRHRRLLKKLGPLIIKEKTGDGFPIKLVVGPFSSAAQAVSFCSSLGQKFNCNLKRYKGTPL